MPLHVGSQQKRSDEVNWISLLHREDLKLTTLPRISPTCAARFSSLAAAAAVCDVANTRSARHDRNQMRGPILVAGSLHSR